MILIFYFFAAILIYFSLKSYLGGISFLNYVRSELAKDRSEFTPFVTIIAPCKGTDQGLAENLTALLEQDYPDYEVIFVIDDVNDPAAGTIREILDSNRFHLVIAPRAEGSSQKVENLREAVHHVRDDSEVFVFVDSDARPSKGWLRSLVAPLDNERIGAATGYRWFLSNKPSLATELRSAWNASIASALGPNLSSNFCWGGSMAIRRSVFETLEIRDAWQGTLSDDFTVTRAMKAADLDIYFVPKALTPSIENCSFREMIEFTNRQMKITRVYASHLWLLSYFGSIVFNLTLIWAMLILITQPMNTLAFRIAAATILLVFLCSIAKSYLRWKAVRLILTGYPSQVHNQFWPQITLWLVTPAIFLYNCICASVSRRIDWRGSVYEMISARETRLLRKVGS